MFIAVKMRCSRENLKLLKKNVLAVNMRKMFIAIKMRWSRENLKLLNKNVHCCQNEML